MSFLEINMKRVYRLFIVAITLLSIAGCIPLMVGTLAYTGSKNDETKQKWFEEYNKMNLAREKEGLKPLDYCTEARRFDTRMADNDPECKPVDKPAGKPATP